MERTCLVGYTGFVGGNLHKQHNFSAIFNSTNISKIFGQEFDTLVCAAAPGSMFEANKYPKRDLEKVQDLIDKLFQVKARRFIIISSIAVLEDFASGDDESANAFQKKLAYGLHRRTLEAFVETNFDEHLVVRLPALYGQGLRKNFLFDLLNPVPTMLTKERLEELSVLLPKRQADLLIPFYAHDIQTGMQMLNRMAFNSSAARNDLENASAEFGFHATLFHNPETTYQYYNISRLWADIEIALNAGLRHAHFATEPIRASEIYRHLTGKNMPNGQARLHHEDIRTRHADLWGKQGPYLEDRETVLEQLAVFYAREKRTS